MEDGMKFISVRDFRIRPGVVWDSLKEDQEVIITSNGKPIALLTGISDINLDDTVRILRRVKTEMAVSRMRKTAVKKGLSGLSQKEIESEVGATRKARR